MTSCVRFPGLSQLTGGNPTKDQHSVVSKRFEPKIANFGQIVDTLVRKSTNHSGFKGHVTVFDHSDYPYLTIA